MGLSLTTNSTARMSSVVSVNWANITGIPVELSGFGGITGTGIVAAIDAAGNFATRTLTGTANQITITNGNGVSANPVVSLPSALTFTGFTITGGTYASPTFTGSMTIPSPFTLGATSVTTTGTQLNYLAAATGTTGTTSTNVVFSTSPTLVTPTLGAATATTINKLTITAPATSATLGIADGKALTVNNTLALQGTDATVMNFPTTTATIARTDAGQTFTGTNAFGVITATTLNGNTFTTGTYTLTGTAGKTFTFSNTLTLSGTDSSTLNVGVGGTLTGSSSAAVFFDNIPQNSQSAAYVLVLGDAQKHILHPTADNNPRTFTIPSNASVAYATGTVITFVNQINTVTVAITADTMTLAGAGTTGSRTLAASGIATALKIASTSWIISGSGLT